MGNLISWSASSVIFPAPPCSYDESWIGYIKVPKLSYSTSYSFSRLKKSFVPAFEFIAQTATPTTLVYSHGNAEDIGTCYRWMKYLSETLNVNVVCYDYQGYGLHSGSSSENECYYDLECVLKYLKGKGISNQDIILYGRSIGTGPTVEIASRQNGSNSFKAIILEAPYRSLFNVVSNSVAYTSSSIDPFNNESKIDKIKSPIVILHGLNDKVISYGHSIVLQKKSNCKLVVLQEGNHNNLASRYSVEIVHEINKLI